MDHRINSAFIKNERQKRGWSQEQLAAAAGLGIRTIQRIEAAGAASQESAKCLAAVFEVPFTRLFRAEDRPRRSTRLVAAGAATCAILVSSLLLLPHANATDVAMAIVLNSDVTGESRMNVQVRSGLQTQIKLEKDLRLLLTPKLRGDGTILVTAEVHAWDGTGFVLAGKPSVLLRQGSETGIRLGLGGGRSADVRITARES